jgi:hypothetical protein
VPAAGPSNEHIEIGQGAEVIDAEVCDEDLVEFVESDPAGDVVRDRSLPRSNTKFSPLPNWMKTDVFICPGRIIGDVPMKMILISSGPTFSVRGNQFAAAQALIVGPLMYQRFLARTEITNELIELAVDAYMLTRSDLPE